MYYPEEIIEEVRVQNDIVDIISEYVTLTKKGNSYFGLCPFHNEKTPSFSVSSQKQMYYCFGCGAGGNVISFIMQKENYNFIEALQLLAKKRNILLPEAEYTEIEKKTIQRKQLLFDMHKDAARYFYFNLQQNTNNDVKEYLVKRGMRSETQKRFGLGYANANYYDLYQYLKKKNYDEELIFQSGLAMPSKKGSGGYDRFNDRLMFPIFDVHGKIIAFGGRVLDNSHPKYLNSPDTELFNKSVNLYGLNYARIAGKKEIFIVEGYMDVIAMYQAGFHNTVASLGTAFTSGHAQLLKRYVDEVILLYDSDDAGIRATLRAIPILQSAHVKVRILHLPDQKDPDDYIAENGIDAMNEIAERAMGAVPFQIQIMKRNYNLENVEQKIKFIEEVATLLATLNNAVEQEIYTTQMAKDYRIDIDALKAEVRKKMQSMQAMQTMQTKTVDSSNKGIQTQPVVTQKQDAYNGYFKVQAELLQLMCTYPNVLNIVKKYMSPDEFVDPFFQKLASLIYEKEANGYVNEPSQLVSYFDTTQEQNKVANIFLTSKQYENDEIILKIMNDTIKKLKIRALEQQLKATTDITQLQKLLQLKKELDKLYIGSISG